MTDPTRPAIALVAPYWDFWAHSTPFDLRESRVELLRQGAQLLARAGDVVAAEVVDVDNVDKVSDELAASAPDVVVVMQTMATPPAVTTQLLSRRAGRPLVIWAARAEGSIADSFDHAAVTSQGATVGTPMITSMLVRAGTPFELVVGALDNDETYDALRTSIRVSLAADRVRRARIGRLGRPIAGYDCVDLSTEALASDLGATVVPIEPAEFAALYDEVGDEAVGQGVDRVSADTDVDPAVDGDAMARAVRSTAALAALSERHRLDAGAFNCHVPEIRLGDRIGVAPCFALGQETSAGRPWTCSGDVVTVVAMLILKALGAAAFYHELEAFDPATGVFVQANTGEHDLALSPNRPRLVVNPWYPGPPASVCAQIEPEPGPATLVGFAQLDTPPRHRLIVASGEFVGRGYPQTGTTNAGFRFTGNATASWRAWVRAGANHHGAVTPGDLIDDLRGLATALGLDLVEIDREGAS